MLNVSTMFPRAGERNVLVEEFIDLCVATWEASGAVGEHVGWVLDVRFSVRGSSINSSELRRRCGGQPVSHSTRIASFDTCQGCFMCQEIQI